MGRRMFLFRHPLSYYLCRMKTKNTICRLYGIQHPIIQGGMAWCSGWKLASAVSNQGGLGLIGAGSMHPETLREHIQKCKNATNRPFGVNVPLMYPRVDEIMHIIRDEKVRIVFTSAGNPKLWTEWLHQHNILVAHVVSSSKFSIKCQEAGVDVVVAEGFEAGGHNGKEETSTFCLIPRVREVCSLPLIAAGGISSGSSYRAALALGAEGVQIGTRFALCMESSAHPEFKHYCRNLQEGMTQLMLKKLSPTRLALNDFAKRLAQAEDKGASAEELSDLLGKGRAKKGIFEGDLKEGALEIGQCAGSVRKEESVQDIFEDILSNKA